MDLRDGRFEAVRGSWDGGVRVGVGGAHAKDEIGTASVSSDLEAARADETPARVEEGKGNKKEKSFIFGGVAVV
jgi:hypothetical protein